MLKIDLHVHSEYSDSVSSIDKILEAAEEKGLDGIAITDHGTLDGWRRASKTNSEIIIIPGVEIQTRQGHIQVLGVKKIPFSIDEDLTIFEVAKKMRTRDSLIILPHSCTPFFSTKREIIERLKPDALEVINSLSPFYDIVEANLHMKIYENIINFKTPIYLSMETVKDWHRTLFSLHPLRNNFAGLIRKGRIYISGSNYVPPPGGIVCERLVNELFEWYTKNVYSIHPALLACLMHFYFVSIHPFDDGNGRMCRLIMNYILFKNNYPMFDLPYRIRKSYYNALEKSNIKEDDMIFVGWFFKNYLKYLGSLKL